MANFKIGGSWVSFYLNNIASIRNNDWNKLNTYFEIPNPARTIDFQKTKLKSNIKIPNKIEFVISEINSIEDEIEETILIHYPYSEKPLEKPAIVAMAR